MFLLLLATALIEEAAVVWLRAPRGWLFCIVLGGYSLMNLMPGGTPGKRLEAVRILDQNGADAAFGPRLLRWVIHYGLTIAIVLIVCETPEKLGVPFNWRTSGARRLLSLLILLQLAHWAISILLIVSMRRSLADLVSGTYVGTAALEIDPPHVAFEVIPLGAPAEETPQTPGRPLDTAQAAAPR